MMGGAELLPISRRAYLMAMPLAVPRYTIADLDGWPEDGNRYELLRGILLVTPAPGPPHQVVLGRLTIALSTYLGSTGPAILVTPGVVQHADDTQLEPDLLVFPSRLADQASWRHITGWWLAVEVSGPASRIYDRDFKRAAYLGLGVREFWRLDLRDRRLYRSRGDEIETPFVDRMNWHPPEMAAPCTLDIGALFG